MAEQKIHSEENEIRTVQSGIVAQMDAKDLINKMHHNENGRNGMPSSFLLSAMLLLFKRHTRMDRFRVSIKGSKGLSDHPEASGGFLSELSLHISIPGDPTFVQIMNNVAQSTLTQRDVYIRFFMDQYVRYSFEDLRKKQNAIQFKIVSERFPGIEASILFPCHLQEPLILTNLTKQYEALVNQAIAYPEQKASQFNLLSDEEKDLLLNQWNNTDFSFPKDKCLHTLIEEQVVRTPEKIALYYKDKSITYEAMNAKANQLAHELIAMGVRADDKVALFTHLSIDAVIAVLGILKAGAAYLPLHLDYPQGRLEYIKNHATPRAIISTKGYEQQIEKLGLRTFYMEDFDGQQQTENPNTTVAPSNLAYTIFTSGSTSMPKGVLIEHGSVVNNIELIKKRYELTQEDTVLSMPTLAFDASVSKLFPALTIGGAVVLPTSEDSLDAEKMVNLVKKYNCPYFAASPSLIRIINDMNPDLSSLRVVTSGGEQLKYTDVSNILNYVPVYNVYGPTEATVSSCTYKIPKGETISTKKVPIGRPNPNCKVYVLDDQMNLMPIGAYGTLYIGGAGVARGYLNDEELTSQKFLPNPFAEGERFYNSGDVVRWLPDGNLEFFGRDDHQIKVRGYRISTEEIEHFICSHPNVTACKTIVHSNGQGTEDIVGFVTVEEMKRFSSNDLKVYLKEKLPHYMIPSRIIALDAMPINRNEKIDSVALREILQNTDQPKPSQVSTNTSDTSQTIIDFAKGLLDVSELQPSDNFFNVGGHSLHAMQLKIFLGKTFDIKVSVGDIFKNPTFKEIEALVLAKKAPSETEEKDGSTDASFVENELLPLSASEKRLWFLYQYLSNKSLYNIVNAFRIKGALDTGALTRGLQDIAVRHPNLKKAFTQVDGEPKAKILLGTELEVPISILEGGEVAIAEEIAQTIQTENNTPFDLENGLPYRAQILKISEKEHILILSFHHIISDAWSFDLFAKELGVLYHAYKAGSTVELHVDGLHQSYREYAQSEPKSNQEDLTYWMDALKERLSQMSLPYDFPASEDKKDEGGVEEFMLPDALTAKVNEFARDKGATLFMTYISALQTLLHIYSQDEYITTAFPIAGRDESTQDLQGFFVNTLLLNNQINPTDSYTTVLETAKEKMMEAYEHSALPFEVLANELRKNQGINADNLIQVMFTYQNTAETLTLDGLSTHTIAIEEKPVKFDLTFNVIETANGTKLSVEYRKGRFEQATIQRFVDYYARLLTFISNNADLPIKKINFINEAERDLILNDWNDTARPLPDLSIQELFEEQAIALGDQPAIVFNDHESLTYKEFDQQSNQLAHYLISKKQKRNELIGILMEENHETLLTIMGILKAGCGYLPLDPGNPEERLKHMLDSCKVNLVVTTKKFKKFIPKGDYKLIVLEVAKKQIAKEAISEVSKKSNPDDLACVMFTSGSTGKPKAVGVEHRSIVRLVRNTNYLDFEQLAPKSRVLKTGAFAFDASTFEMWGMFLNGGTIYLYEKGDLLSPSFLKEKIAANQISMMWLTTSWFNQLAETDVRLFAPLKHLLIGGEKVSAKHINMVKEAHPSLELYNMYGPTENTTFSVFQPLDADQPDDVPIGRPIANSTVYVVNEDMELLPPGLTGELFLGGQGVARGYLNDAALTTEKFMASPFREGERLYKSGDLGKWTKDGLVLYRGRKDKQVKVNGFRLEIAEIQNCLTSHPMVEKSLVLLKETAGKKQVIAFFTVHDEVPTHEELRTFMSKSLPKYMVPVQFIDLERFPLNANGKADTRKLLEQVEIVDHEDSAYTPPTNAMEKELAELWAEVLGQTNVSVTSSFFHMGGHSLLAVKLMGKIEAAFKHTLPVSALFESPTIRELAARITEENKGGHTCLVKVQPNGTKTPIFVIPGYLFYYNLAKHLGNDQPLYGFEPLPDATIKKEARHYIKEIKEIQPEGPYLLGGYCAGGIVAYEIAQQMRAKGDEIGMLALFECYTPEGTVSKASAKYITEKVKGIKNNLKQAHGLKGKIKAIRKEVKRGSEYFQSKVKNIQGQEYVIKPYGGEMKIFRATDGMIGASDDPYAGWTKYCDKDKLEVIRIPGNHDTIFKEPHVQVTATKLGEHVASVVSAKEAG